MPIYFLLSIWVLLSVGSEPTPQAYFERGALFYNALTAGKPAPLEMASSCEERHSPDARTAGRTRPAGRAGACGGSTFSVSPWRSALLVDSPAVHNRRRTW